MVSRSFSSLFYLAGVFVLAFALPSARSFLGSSVAFFFLQNAHGVLSVIFLKFMGNLVAAFPFGLLYGYIVSRHTAKSAALFASVAAAFVIWFQVWIGIEFRYWLVLDAFFFIVFFSLFAAFTNRFATPPSAHGRTIAAATFVLLGVFCYYGPLVYFTYVYVPKVQPCIQEGRAEARPLI